MKEEWKSIEGYGGMYLISNYGRCHSLKGGRRKELFTNYAFKLPSVSLSLNGNSKWIPVCLLVANAFLDNPEKKSKVRFINGDKRIARVNNLEWV